MLLLFGVFKVALIGILRPRIIELNDTSIRVAMKKSRISRNHLGSIYLGSLCVGADVAAGFHAFYFARRENLTISLAFAGMKANFLRRADGNVIFESTSGELVMKKLQESASSGERETFSVPVHVYSEKDAAEQIAEFEMDLSVKVKSALS